MANFVRAWPGSGLAFNAPPGSANLNVIDQQLVQAINGGGGGTWAPSSVITIGGSGVALTGPINASGAFTASNVVSLDITGAMTLDVGATFLIAGTTAVALGGAVNFVLGSSLTMALGSTATIGGTTTFNGPTTLNGTTAIAGGTTLSGTMTQTGPLSKSGNGAINAERVQEIDNTQPTVTISTNADVWYVLGITAVGTSVYTLRSTGPTPPTGARISLQVYNTGLTQSIEVQRQGGGGVVGTFGSGDGGIDVVFWGGGWKLVGFWGSFTPSSPYS